MRAIYISDASGETAPVKPWELLGQTCTPEANDMRLAPRTSTSPSRAACLIVRTCEREYITLSTTQPRDGRLLYIISRVTELDIGERSDTP